MKEVIKEADSIFLKINDTVAHQKNVIIKENSSKPYVPNLNSNLSPKNDGLMGISSNLRVGRGRIVNEERSI